LIGACRADGMWRHFLMKLKLESDDSAAKQIHSTEDTVYDPCGQFGAFHIGERTL